MRDREVQKSAPFHGMSPFTPEDAPFFFGREVERDVLYAHLRSHRLTILYGRSGVGKSSLLQAGLIGHLLGIGDENMARAGTREVAVVFIHSWSRKPSDVIRQVTLGAPHGELREALESHASRSGGILFLILDQFEDYLRREDDQEFEAALDGIVNARDSSIRVLISIQEEFLARLDRLEARIPGLFARALRLEPLDPRGVESAIVGPLETWNDLHDIPPERAYRAEQDLIAELLGQLLANNLSAESADSPIGTAYLQVVMRRLWAAEVSLGSHQLRKATLENLRGVAHIVQEHLNETLSEFSRKERSVAAEVLRFLVTPIGNINALTAMDLAAYTRLRIEVVEDVLTRLSRVRVVRAVSGANAAILYEIAHQSLGTAIRHWREEVDRRRHLKWKTVAIAVGVALLALLAGSGWRLRQEQRRLSRAGVLTEQSASLRSSRFDLSLLLSICALDVGGESSDSALVQNLRAPEANGMFIGWSSSPVLRTMSDVAVTSITVASFDGWVRSWSGMERRSLTAPMRADWGNIADVVFSGDGRVLALVAPDSTVRIRSTLDHLFPIASFGVDGASVVAITDDGGMIAVGSTDGAVHIHRVPFTGEAETLKISEAPIETLSLSSDGHLLTTGSADGSIRLSSSPFRPADARLVKQRGESVRCIVFSSNGQMFAAGTADGVVHLWSAVADTWTEQVFRMASGIRALAFDAAASHLAAAGEDGVIQVWSATSAEMVARLPGHRDTRMRSVTFTADGRIVSGQDDGSIRLWTIPANLAMIGRDLDTLRSRACAIANRNLSTAEWSEYMGSEPYRPLCPDKQ
ncbi:MAG TPA: hypothetical protein VGQ76_09655 [Thermoanaerobaculia bacterium]|nr:hypothetical protein [Thermoanaerobaculia bacterium]